MGRKNKITSNNTNYQNINLNYLEENNNNVDIQKKLKKNIEEENKYNLINETFLEMINYIDIQGLPLCQYLSTNILEEFINYLS